MLQLLSSTKYTRGPQIIDATFVPNFWIRRYVITAIHKDSRKRTITTTCCLQGRFYKYEKSAYNHDKLRETRKQHPYLHQNYSIAIKLITQRNIRKIQTFSNNLWKIVRLAKIFSNRAKNWLIPNVKSLPALFAHLSFRRIKHKSVIKQWGAPKREREGHRYIGVCPIMVFTRAGHRKLRNLYISLFRDANIEHRQ